jgi:hypothetical protein
MKEPKVLDLSGDEPKRFTPHLPIVAASFYKRRSLEQLPADLLAACNELRAQRRDIDTLRSQLRNARIKNAVLMAVIGGGMAKAIEVAVTALIHVAR